MDSNLNQYKLFVSQLAQNKDNRVFINSDKEHAVTVLVELINHANDTIRIFAGCLSDPIGNDQKYIEALSNFIERNGKIRILLNDYKAEKIKQSNLFKRLLYYISDRKEVGSVRNILIRQTEKRAYFTEDPEKKPVHFTVSDEMGYRIETDIKNRTAECNFNDPDMSKKLVEIFDAVFENEDQSSSIDLNKLFNDGIE